MELVPSNSAILHEICSINENLEEARVVANEMLAFLKTHPEGFAISAPQVGITKRIFVFDDGRVFINPEILTPKSGVKIPPRMWNKPIEMGEGCLSFPGVAVPVPRWESIKVRYIDKDLKVIEERLKGIAAMAFQHELDHLNGITIMDHLEKLEEEKKKMHKGKTHEQSVKVPNLK